MSAYYRTGLTGGTVDDLDAIDTTGFTDKLLAIVEDGSNFYMYRFSSSSSASESSPDVIAPDTGTGRWILQTDAAAVLPLLYISEFTIGNNATDANNDMDIGVGACRDIADAIDIKLSSALTKQLDASWVAGTNQGGLSSSLTKANDTIYWIHAIIVDGSADVGFDTSATAANLVTDHSATAYRPLGYLRTDASGNIISAKWLTRGSSVTMYFDARQTVATGLTSTTYTTLATTGWIPTGLNNVEALFGGLASGANLIAFLSHDGINLDRNFNAFFSDNGIGGTSELGNYQFGGGMFVPIIADQVYYKVNNYTLTLFIKAVRFGR